MLQVRRLAEHHSTGDWDFDSTNWLLDTVVYVSAPSSMRNTTTSGPLVTVKTGVVPIANVKEGRIVLQLRASHVGYAGRFRIIFRYQDGDNYYFARYDDPSDTLKIYRRKTAADTELATLAWYFVAATWYLIRVTWWNDYVGLVIRVEHYEAGAWVIKLEAYDATNEWKDIGGKVGFRPHGGTAGLKFNVDDTDIYGVV